MFSDLKELRVKGPAIFFNLRRTYRFLGFEFLQVKITPGGMGARPACLGWDEQNFARRVTTTTISPFAAWTGFGVTLSLLPLFCQGF